MKIDLSDLKIGDKVFSIEEGSTKVISIIDYIIHIKSESYFEDGKSFDKDIHPSLFHSIEECIEYFQSVKKEMDEESKPKKKYWIWSYRPKEELGYWGKCPAYLDDNGITSTNYNYFNGIWDKLEKIKHDNEFIDV